MPRIFIAIPLSDHVRAALSAVAAESRQHARALRWVAPHQYHVTLKFLGDVAEGQVRVVQEALEAAATGHTQLIRLRARGVGAFPNTSRARTVWVGVAGDNGDLHKIHMNVEEQLAARGFPREKRPFRPHITVARSRSAEPLPPPLQRYEEHDFGSWPVHRIQVIESHVSAAGPRYIVQHEIALDGGG